ncbi:MAG: hypothetical protein V4673_14505 [Pseudomonadota bacterium]
MVIKRRGVVASLAKVGDKVRSKSVGLRAAFDGVIVEMLERGCNVKDANGQIWQRQFSELEAQ